MTTDLATFINGLPKIELHLHLEGSLEPELMFALARRNRVDIPFKTVEDIRAAYKFQNLQGFLDIYYQGMNVLKTEQDFYDLTMAYLTKIHSQNVVHTEVFFDPQGHTDRGIPFATVINGITRALTDGQSEFGITSKLIMCFLRHLPEDSAFATLAAAEPYKELIYGVGLDSSEQGFPPSNFARVFAKARQQGYALVAHAGEEGPPEYVREALDILHVDRIDHGNRSMEDPELVARLAKDKMGLTVCPLSNLALCNVDRMDLHPLKRMLDAGLMASINSDDPSYFGGYMTENLTTITTALGLTKADIVTLSRNAIQTSFLTPDEKTRYHLQLEAYCEKAASKIA